MEEQKESKIELIRQISNENLIQSVNTYDILSIVFDVINSILNGIIVTDKKGVICFANPGFCKMFEYDNQMIIGKDATEIFMSKQIRKSFSDTISFIDINKVDKEEFIVKKSDGSESIIELSSSNVTSATNKILGRVIYFIDITLTKKIESDRDNLIVKLQNALDTIKTLKGNMTNCLHCKKMQDDNDVWEQIEAYISSR